MTYSPNHPRSDVLRRAARQLGRAVVTAGMLLLTMSLAPTTPGRATTPDLTAERLGLEIERAAFNLDHRRVESVGMTLAEIRELAAHLDIEARIVPGEPIDLTWEAWVSEDELNIINIYEPALGSMTQVQAARLLVHEQLHLLQYQHGVGAEIVEAVMRDAPAHLQDDPDSVWAYREAIASCADGGGGMYRPGTSCTVGTQLAIADWLEQVDGARYYPFVVNVLMGRAHGQPVLATYDELRRIDDAASSRPPSRWSGVSS